MHLQRVAKIYLRINLCFLPAAKFNPTIITDKVWGYDSGDCAVWFHLVRGVSKLCNNREQNYKIKISDKPLENVAKFNYVGKTMTKILHSRGN
jgi:hypothetical protein